MALPSGSLIFIVMALDPVLMALIWFNRPLPKWTKPLVTCGRVLLFFYLLNLSIPHLLGILLAAASGQSWHHLRDC